MFKSIVVGLAKRYAIKAVNQLLTEYKDETQAITRKITVWTTRLESIVQQLKSINSRVSDGRIDDEEVSITTAELKRLVKDF